MKNNAYIEYISNLNKVYELSKQNKSDSSQEIYVGDRNINGQPHGKGKKTMPDGSYYDGQWIDGKFIEGIGKKIYDDGAIYEGGIKNEKRYGQGTYALTFGISAEGYWSEDEVDEYGSTAVVRGVKKNKGRIIFEGMMDILDNVILEKEGKYYFEDGAYVEGIFEEKGKGIYTFPNGDIYEGELNFLTIHGKGVLKKVDGSIVEGVWKKGVIDEVVKGKNCSIKISVEDVDSPCGDLAHGDGIYMGEIKNGKPNGEGTFIYNHDKGKYIGQWKNGRFDGKGLLEVLNLCYGEEEGSLLKYDGEWKEGKAHGDGFYRCEAADEYKKGKWVEGRFFEGDMKLNRFTGEVRNYNKYHGREYLYSDEEYYFEGYFDEDEGYYEGYYYYPGRFIGDMEYGRYKKGRWWWNNDLTWVEGEYDREGNLIKVERAQKKDGSMCVVCFVNENGGVSWR